MSSWVEALGLHDAELVVLIERSRGLDREVREGAGAHIHVTLDGGGTTVLTRHAINALAPVLPIIGTIRRRALPQSLHPHVHGEGVRARRRAGVDLAIGRLPAIVASGFETDPPILDIGQSRAF